jgi:hypothetical protein
MSDPEVPIGFVGTGRNVIAFLAADHPARSDASSDAEAAGRMTLIVPCAFAFEIAINAIVMRRRRMVSSPVSDLGRPRSQLRSRVLRRAECPTMLGVGPCPKHSGVLR